MYNRYTYYTYIYIYHIYAPTYYVVYIAYTYIHLYILIKSNSKKNRFPTGVALECWWGIPIVYHSITTYHNGRAKLEEGKLRFQQERRANLPYTWKCMFACKLCKRWDAKNYLRVKSRWWEERNMFVLQVIFLHVMATITCNDTSTSKCNYGGRLSLVCAVCVRKYFLRFWSTVE